MEMTYKNELIKPNTRMSDELFEVMNQANRRNLSWLEWKWLLKNRDIRYAEEKQAAIATGDDYWAWRQLGDTRIALG